MAWRPTRAGLPLKREAEPTAARRPAMARPASLGGKRSAARRPAEAGLPLKGEAEPTTARRPTTTRPANPGKGQAFCGPKAGRGKPACPRAQRQANCGPKANSGKPAEAPHWQGASQLRWQTHAPNSALLDVAHSCVCVGGGLSAHVTMLPCGCAITPTTRATQTTSPNTLATTPATPSATHGSVCSE